MIYIDYQAGAHGNFLEFACNVVAGVESQSHPFNKQGASHNKIYLTEKLFYANHYSFLNIPMAQGRVLAINIEEDDLLPLSQISLLRAGDFGYDNNELEINTYNKLNNTHYRWVLDTILNSFFQNQISNSYNAVKDPSWPKVQTLDEFRCLPDYIRRECVKVHNLELLELSEKHPNCPRHVLREFFQIGFENPSNHGFMARQKLMVYKNGMDVYKFPFSAFYNTETFLNQIKSIAHWADLAYTSNETLTNMHSMFLERQPYKNSKNKCDLIIGQLVDNLIDPPKLNLIEEAYVNAMLKKSGYECRY